jgi:hypothetical protein
LLAVAEVLDPTAPVQVAAYQRPLVLLSPQLLWVLAVNEKLKLNPETGRWSSVVKNDTATPPSDRLYPAH